MLMAGLGKAFAFATAVCWFSGAWGLQGLGIHCARYALKSHFRSQVPALFVVKKDAADADKASLIVDATVAPETSNVTDHLSRFERSNPDFSSKSTPVVTATTTNPFALYDWQLEALSKWELVACQGIIDAVTGAGKTRLALAAIHSHFKSEGKTIVLVPTSILLHQWVNNLRKAAPEMRVGMLGDGTGDTLDSCDVLVAIVASARSRIFPLPDGVSGLLVADECHRCASDKNQNALQPHFKKRLGLSATHERMDEGHTTILLPYFKQVAFAMDYKRAIVDGVICGVRVALVGVDFTQAESDEYKALEKSLYAEGKSLIKNFGPSDVSQSLFSYVTKLKASGNRKEGIQAGYWLTKWRKKGSLVASSTTKQAALAALAGVISDADRTLVYTSTILTAIAAAELLNQRGIVAEAHHSKVSPKDRQAMLHRFASGDTRVLATVQTLDEGVDVPEADLAIILASSQQRRQMVQRMGRIMRRKSDGRDARFLIVYVRKTSEDLAEGAKETFISELLDVATKTRMFSRADDAQLRAFLDPASV